jgi:hypothetical protein
MVSFAKAAYPESWARVVDEEEKKAARWPERSSKRAWSRPPLRFRITARNQHHQLNFAFLELNSFRFASSEETFFQITMRS